ncbi:phosphoribosylformylglycinamidine synthase subunit PurQ [Thalassobaculum sp.]|uniref:phosphoribosylformylglycinamidine synthase subunit PurQ n=1 Tax=Thalassobaculum sp. TaxID=2022740 RepID=UPI0032ECB340
MKSAIIVFPGSNRDRDMMIALRQAFGSDPLMVWHKEVDLPAVDLIVVPGGFSYGDYLRAGAMGAHSPAMRTVKERADKGVPVLGVCNGFQTLTEAGMLPGALMRNASLKFICKTVHLRVESSQSIFTGGYTAGQTIAVPVAHNDGNYYADEATLDRLEDRGLVAFRYVDADGGDGADANPNGSRRNIAGIFNETKTVLGLMPHPEDAIDPLHGGTEGRGLFDGLARALA